MAIWENYLIFFWKKTGQEVNLLWFKWCKTQKNWRGFSLCGSECVSLEHMRRGVALTAFMCSLCEKWHFEPIKNFNGTQPSSGIPQSICLHNWVTELLNNPPSKVSAQYRVRPEYLRGEYRCGWRRESSLVSGLGFVRRRTANIWQTWNTRTSNSSTCRKFGKGLLSHICLNVAVNGRRYLCTNGFILFDWAVDCVRPVV